MLPYKREKSVKLTVSFCLSYCLIYFCHFKFCDLMLVEIFGFSVLSFVDFLCDIVS